VHPVKEKPKDKKDHSGSIMVAASNGGKKPNKS